MGKHELEFGEPKQTFFRKLKRKIDEIFDGEDGQRLTFPGKIFMMSLYGLFVSIAGIVCTSVVGTIIKVVFELCKVSLTTGLFTGTAVMFWLLFILSFLLFAGFAIFEILYSGENDGDSLLTYPPEEN